MKNLKMISKNLKLILISTILFGSVFMFLTRIGIIEQIYYHALSDEQQIYKGIKDIVNSDLRYVREVPINAIDDYQLPLPICRLIQHGRPAIKVLAEAYNTIAINDKDKDVKEIRYIEAIIAIGLPESFDFISNIFPVCGEEVRRNVFMRIHLLYKHVNLQPTIRFLSSIINICHSDKTDISSDGERILNMLCENKVMAIIKGQNTLKEIEQLVLHHVVWDNVQRKFVYVEG